MISVLVQCLALRRVALIVSFRGADCKHVASHGKTWQNTVQKGITKPTSMAIGL
jgi:hypothetical protein